MPALPALPADFVCPPRPLRVCVTDGPILEMKVNGSCQDCPFRSLGSQARLEAERQRIAREEAGCDCLLLGDAGFAISGVVWKV